MIDDTTQKYFPTFKLFTFDIKNQIRSLSIEAQVLPSGS